jgi:hypothetical protein
MPSFTDLFFASAVLGLVNGHAQILNAQGISGSPASVGFQGMEIYIYIYIYPALKL